MPLGMLKDVLVRSRDSSRLPTVDHKRRHGKLGSNEAFDAPRQAHQACSACWARTAERADQCCGNNNPSPSHTSQLSLQPHDWCVGGTRDRGSR